MAEVQAQLAHTPDATFVAIVRQGESAVRQAAITRTATVGAVTGNGTELFRLIRQGRLEWRAEVTSAELGRLSNGTSAVVTAASGAQLHGKVRMVAPTVDAATRNGIVVAYCPGVLNEAVADYAFSRSERKTLARNADIERSLVEAEATMEQFDLLRRYLLARHADGGMAKMTWPDYVAMVEDTAVRTHILEYRLKARDGGPGDLIAGASFRIVLMRRVVWSMEVVPRKWSTCGDAVG